MNLNATLIAQLVVFFILAWVTMKFVWPPIVKALDERAKKIADGLAAADKAKADLPRSPDQFSHEVRCHLRPARRRGPRPGVHHQHAGLGHAVPADPHQLGRE